MLRVRTSTTSVRRFAALGAVLFLSLLSCGREITGPNGAARFAHGLSFLSQFPGPLANIEDGAGSVIPFDRVRVVFRRIDGSVALDRLVTFPANADEVRVSFSIHLSSDAPRTGEDLDLFLRYLNAAGDTVFAGGPVRVVAAPSRDGEQPPPADVPLTYTGPGADAVGVTVAPDTLTVTAGDPFAFSATALTAQQVVTPDAPIVWTSLDATRATVTAIGAGAGTTLASRGIARIRAALAAGGGEAIGVLVILPRPSALALEAGGNQSAEAGVLLPVPITVRLRATDGLAMANAEVSFAVQSGGLSEGVALTDANGDVSVLWTLGPTIGTQTLTVSSAGVPNLGVTATALERTAMAEHLVLVGQPGEVQVSGVGLTPAIVVEARDSTNALVTSYGGTVSIEIVDAPAGGALEGTTNATASGGIAVFDNVRATIVGSYRLRVTAAGLTPDTTLAFGLGAGAAATIAVVTGDNQTARVSAAVQGAIAVRVRDAAGNPVPGVSVTYAVTGGGGSLQGAVQSTDSTGLATLGSWTVGPDAGTNTLSASAGSATPATITATAEPLDPVIVLSVVGSSVVGFERAGTAQVRLLQAAPQGGLVVTIVSSNASVLSVNSPGSVTIASGDTLGTIGVFGVAAGTATLSGTGTGYTAGSLVVPVSLNVISLPLTLNVPFEQTASLPVQISPAAPAGGVTVTLTSAAPGAVTTTAPTVSFAQGVATANATVQGLALGQTTITATNPNYAPATVTVNVTAAVDIVPTTLALDGSFGNTFAVRLLSGATVISAPGNGVLVTLTPADPTCVNVPATVLIPGGLTSANVFVEAGTSATLPCSSVITATGPEGFTSDAITANVAAVPSVTATARNIGSGFHGAVNFTLGSSRHGGTTVTVTSPDPARLLIAPNNSTVGAASWDIPVAIGSTSGEFWVQVLESVVNDTLAVTLSAPSFNTGTGTVRVWQPVFQIQNVIDGTTIQGDRSIYVDFGTPSTPTGTFISINDQIRVGGAAQTFSIINDSLPVVDLVTSLTIADSVTVTAQPRTSSTPTTVANNGVATRFTAEGTATLRATHPTYRALAGATRNLVVTQPSIQSITQFSMLGYGLQRQGSLILSSDAPEGGVQVTLAANRASRVLLSPSASVVGTSDTLVVTVSAGVNSASFFVQALEGTGGDTLTLTATAPGYTENTSTIRLTAPVFDISGWFNTATTANTDRSFRVTIGSPNATDGASISVNDNIRAGAASRPVSIVTDSVAYGTLVSLAGTTDSLDLTINALQTITPSTVANGGVAFRYLAVGTGQVRASVPGMRPLAGAQRFVTITQPSISTLSTVVVGSGLQRSGTVSLSSAAEDAVVVTITAATPNRILFAPANNVVGTESIQLTINPGGSSATFVVQALEDIVADTVGILATAAGYTGRAASVRIWQPVIQLGGLTTPTSTLRADDPFVANIGTPSSNTGTSIASNDVLRFGAPARTVTFEVAPDIAALVTTAATGSLVTAQIPAGGSSTPISVAAGGAAFRPLAVGTVTVSGASPGFRQLAFAVGTPVTINAPTIGLNTVGNVGAGLQLSASGALSASQHGGVAITIRSSNPGVVRVAPNTSTVGTDSIVINLANGFTSFSYVVSGVEGALGTVTITATATGFLDGSTTSTVVAPAIGISSLNTTGTAGVTVDDPFVVQVGLPNGQLTGFSSTQVVRAGGSLTATITSSNATAGPLITLAAPTGAGSVTVIVPSGTNISPTSVAGGGVALRFAQQGSTTVNATAPGFVQITPSTVNVIINAP